MRPVVLLSLVVLAGLVVCLMLWRCYQDKLARILWLSAAKLNAILERWQLARSPWLQPAIAQTLQMISECFGVGVVSEPRMASAGVEPWMGSSTD